MPGRRYELPRSGRELTCVTEDQQLIAGDILPWRDVATTGLCLIQTDAPSI